MTQRMRHAIVGLGGRHALYRDALLTDFADTSQLVALADINAGRLALSRQAAQDAAGLDVLGYAASDFDRMIDEARPDVVIVTTSDCHHDHYLCRAMELGCDVITEKPMTIDAKRCRRILDTQHRTGRRCTVTFNYRFAPPRTQVKDILSSGVIGEVLSVDFHWLLDLHHGADYFRRWHRSKANSGGLMVHKATHHFDLVNWWLSDVPQSVYAAGGRRFYLPATAERYHLAGRGERCLDCAAAKRCPFYLDLRAEEHLKRLYLDHEAHDGYVRDQCVFSDRIDIEDSMSLVVGYRGGATMSYSLTACSPWEGYTVSFTGTQGRLEHRSREVLPDPDRTAPGTPRTEEIDTRIFPHRQAPCDVPVWRGQGSHGGADPTMLRYLFDPTRQAADPYLRLADQRAGAWSILVGVAANRSMATGQAVRIDKLVTDLDLPDYPPRPGQAAGPGEATQSLPADDEAGRYEPEISHRKTAPSVRKRSLD